MTLDHVPADSDTTTGVSSPSGAFARLVSMPTAVQAPGAAQEMPLSHMDVASDGVASKMGAPQVPPDSETTSWSG